MTPILTALSTRTLNVATLSIMTFIIIALNIVKFSLRILRDN
jgi:hypothetical protein